MTVKVTTREMAVLRFILDVTIEHMMCILQHFRIISDITFSVLSSSAKVTGRNIMYATTTSTSFLTNLSFCFHIIKKRGGHSYINYGTRLAC